MYEHKKRHDRLLSSLSLSDERVWSFRCMWEKNLSLRGCLVGGIRKDWTNFSPNPMFVVKVVLNY